MAQTYNQLQKKIQQLQRQADALRNTEMNEVIARIKVAIEHYGITASQLGLDGTGRRSAGGAAASRGGAGRAKYGDGDGNVWSGRGPRPKWLRSALEAGRSLEEFASPGGVSAGAGIEKGPGRAAAGTRKPMRRRPSTKLYGDGAGHTWTGRGPKPGWVKAALAEGKSLEDLAR